MIPLKDNWKLPFSFIELWRNMNRMARWLNGMQLEGGQVIHNENGIRLSPGSSGSGSTDFAWNVTGTGLELTLTPGEIEFGGPVGSEPQTYSVIEYADIDTSEYSGTATTGDTKLFIWAKIKVTMESEAAELFSSATSITPLTSEEMKTYVIKKIATVSFTADVVTNIARHQCGNIFIPRL